MRPLAVVVVATLWLGAAVVVAAVVAPAAFAVLPSRTMAGAVVGRVLPVIFLSGCLAAAACLALELSGRMSARGSLRITSAVVWLVACAAAQFVVSPRIERLRAGAGGPIDALAADAPIRVAFGRLHGVSVGLLGVAILGALAIGISAIGAVRARG
jgi:hypothetical protein